MPDSEGASILAELTPPYTLHKPAEQLTPVVFCSPHSGRIYPKAFLEASRLDPHTLRKSEDCYVDELFEPVVALGAPLIAARFPRAYLDVNREPYELDPELFQGRLPAFANTQSARVVGGLGTIARIVADTEEIYRERLSIGAAFQRIEKLYRPFHGALADLLESTRKRFGMAVLIDCHSMPSASMGQPPGGRPAFCPGRPLRRFVRREADPVHSRRAAARRVRGADQPTLRRRLYHRALWESGPQRSCAATGDQPRALPR